MSETVDLVIEDPRWNALDIDRLARQAVRLALEAADIGSGRIEVAVLACSDARIASLNSTFRGKSAATNVLSWPALDLFPTAPGGQPSRKIPEDPIGETSLGDVAIAFETVMNEAQNGQIPVQDHVVHLILHACLHLLGYDHETDEDAQVMERLEVAALAKAGIASPYD